MSEQKIGVNEEGRDTLAALDLTLARSGRYRIDYSEYQVVELLPEGRTRGLTREALLEGTWRQNGRDTIELEPFGALTRRADRWWLEAERDPIAEGFSLRPHELDWLGCGDGGRSGP